MSSKTKIKNQWRKYGKENKNISNAKIVQQSLEKKKICIVYVEKS